MIRMLVSLDGWITFILYDETGHVESITPYRMDEYKRLYNANN
jgi:hypothetical protein